MGFESRYPVLAYLYFGIQTVGDTPKPEKLLRILNISLEIGQPSPSPQKCSNLGGVTRAYGAAGSAPAWHAGGQGFKSP